MEFAIKRKPNYYIVTLIIVWLGILCAITFIMFPAIFIGILTLRDFFITFSFFWLAAIYFFRILLWQLDGIEKISIVDSKLRIKKEGTFWTSTAEYELQYISKFRLTFQNPIPFLLREYSTRGGKIEFEYMDTPKHFGQTIGIPEAKKIIEAFNIELQKAHDSAPEETENSWS